MKQIIFCLLGGLLIPFLLQAQIDQYAIGNLGGEISNTEVSLIQSIGDVAGTHIGKDPEVIQGFVQYFACDDCAKGGVGIEDLYLDPAIRLYPNPTQGQFQLEGPMRLLHRYEVFNLHGQLVSSQQIRSRTIDQTALPAGMYLIRTYGQNGRLSAVLKLHKQ